MEVQLDIPPHTRKIFQLLELAGAKYYALFGGAVRDHNYKEKTIETKDYDIRIWLPEKEDYEKDLKQFITFLESYTQAKVIEMPCIGSQKIRHCFTWNNVELDLTIRPYKITPLTPLHAVALDRIMEADAGISAVAIDPTFTGWARPEYISDNKNKTLTIYNHHHLYRRISYARRLHRKFQEHIIVWL